MFRATQALSRISRSSAVKDTPLKGYRQALLPRRHHPLAVLQTVRFASSDNKDKDKEAPPPKPQIDREAERRIAQEKLKPNPNVSVDSTTRVGWESTPSPGPPVQDMGASLKHDLNIIKDTAKLNTVPRESHILGLAGTIPYFGTSVATIYLAWDLTKQLPTGSAFADTIFLNHDTARHFLGLLETLQLGYGAVIISFLGAIHWGLEYAEKAPQRDRTRFRYGMGVAASIVAWPTVLMSIEYGLISQFAAFVALYFADSRATTRGWAPHWYSTYRFLLTAMVGLAILVSLVGRSEIEKSERLGKEYLSSNMSNSGIADTETNWSKLEAEEKRRIKKAKEEAEKKKKQDEKKANQEKYKAKASGAQNTKNEGDKEEKKGDDKENEDDKGEKKNEEDEKKDEIKDETKEDDKNEKDNGNEGKSDDEGKGDEEEESKDKKE